MSVDLNGVCTPKYFSKLLKALDTKTNPDGTVTLTIKVAPWVYLPNDQEGVVISYAPGEKVFKLDLNSLPFYFSDEL